MIIVFCRDAFKATFFVVKCFDIALGNIFPFASILGHETDAKGIVVIIKSIYGKAGVFVAELSTELNIGKWIACSSVVKHNFESSPLLYLLLCKNALARQQEKEAGKTDNCDFIFHLQQDGALLWINVCLVNIFYFFQCSIGSTWFLPIERIWELFKRQVCSGQSIAGNQ
jgi:hypothetical protein